MAQTVKLIFAFLFGVTASCRFFLDHRKESAAPLPDVFRPLFPPWVYMVYSLMFLLINFFKTVFSREPQPFGIDSCLLCSTSVCITVF